MAKLYPSLQAHAATRLGDYAELDLLQTLERGLSGAFALFHSVDWSRGDGAHELHGEIDIVVVNQAGDVLLMEVKAGKLDFLPEGIFKTYGSQTKNVTAQVGLQYGALRDRLNDAKLPVHLSHLLVLPDLAVQSETVQWPRERIVDSVDVVNIVSRVTRLLGPGVHQADRLERVLRFFENRFRVEPDVSALAGRLQQTVTRLSAGLALWAPRILAPSGVLRVVGTAGSGKTQLALRLLRNADAAGHKAAYICYNRALADHMARVAPVRTPAETFHEFALRVVRRSGGVVDFSTPSAFADMASQCVEVLSNSDADLDLMVLDEMQDMQPEWVQAMLSRLNAQGKAVLLEDPEQQLYKDREAFDIEDAVVVTSNENFRTPRAIVRLINLLRLTDSEVEALSPHEGEISDPIVYESPRKIGPCTLLAVERCLRRGFKLADIAVISMRGREHSVLQTLDTLGDWTMNRFTGKFDAGNAPIWREGDLLLETIRRFKGQAAPAVVLTECDIAELDPINRRLLFVGLTRARVHLEWVISPATAKVLACALE
ncbi:MAG: ATP-dependent helicase [Rhodoferax sp.]|nr:ATP-dependent helicase [Rhodoferax sp.]